MNFLKIILLLLIIISCDNVQKKEIKSKQTNTSIKYAKGFDIQKFTDYIKIIIKTPYPNSTQSSVYNLINKDTDISQFKTTDILLQIPIKKVVVTSTTHIPMLGLLNEEKSLIGFPNTRYISSKKTRELIDDGKIQELGMDANLNTEIVIDLAPDLLIGFAMNAGNKSFKTLESAGIPVLINGDWLEETPLGRAEWLKLFGVLYGKGQLSDSIFNSIEKSYNSAKVIASKSTNRPTILSGALFKDVWNLPAGESFVAQFLKDANTNYLWKETKGKGSLQLNFENVLDKAHNADIWVAPGYFENIEQMLNSSPYYDEFDAFNSKNIYTYANNKGETGGVIYYELAPTRPDLVLKDLIKIAHPNLLIDYKLTFFERIK